MSGLTETSRIKPIDVVFGVLAAALLLLGAFFYMSREKTLYCWDDANFSTLAGQSFQNFFPLNSPDDPFRPVAGAKEVYRSFGTEYNLLFTLPLIPFLKVFGQSRNTFIVALTLFYFIPYCIAWGLVATRLFTISGRRAFWGMFGLSVAMPLTWMSVMHGYPDVGAAALLGFAVYLYLRDVTLKSPLQCIAIGLILCLLPLFRRHYVFGVTAFFGAAILQHLFLLIARVRQDPRSLVSGILHATGRFTLIGGVLVVGLIVLALPFVKLVGGNNYFNLYRSYMNSPVESLASFASAYGLILCAASVIGYFVGFRSGAFLKPQGAFITTLAVVTILQWLFVVQQLGIHYTTHFNAYIVLGLMALFVAASQHLRGAAKIAVFVIGGGLLAYRLLVGFAVMAPFDSPNPSGVFMAKNPPQVRHDYEELKRLLADLRKDAQPGATVHVAASSFTLNAEILRNGEAEVYGPTNVRLRLPQTPDIDSRDWYPLEPFLKADYVITANPVQYCVRPDEQRIVRLMVEAFEQGLPIAQDFTLLPETYALQNGATARIYRRNKPTDIALALRELTREEGLFPTRPGRQKPWLSLDKDYRSYVDPDKDKTFRIALPGPTATELSQLTERKRTLVYLDTPENGNLREVHAGYGLGGPWASQPVTLQTSLADYETGATLATGKPVTLTTPSGEVSLPIPTAPPAKRMRLLLEVTVPETSAPTKEAGSFTLTTVSVR